MESCGSRLVEGGLQEALHMENITGTIWVLVVLSFNTDDDGDDDGNGGNHP